MGLEITADKVGTISTALFCRRALTGGHEIEKKKTKYVLFVNVIYSGNSGTFKYERTTLTYSSVFFGFGKDLGFGIVFVACMQAPRGFSEFSVVEKYRYKRYIRQMRSLYKNTKKYSSWQDVCSVD